MVSLTLALIQLRKLVRQLFVYSFYSRCNGKHAWRRPHHQRMHLPFASSANEPALRAMTFPSLLLFLLTPSPSLLLSRELLDETCKVIFINLI